MKILIVNESLAPETGGATQYVIEMSSMLIRDQHEVAIFHDEADITSFPAGLAMSKRFPEFFGFNYSSSIDPTGSYLAPYITTVGLYSGGDLVAVAKLGMPIKNSGELPLNILVKWDI